MIKSKALNIHLNFKLVLVFWALAATCFGFSQQLSMPQNIKYKKLDNGFSYYLLPEGEPGKVSLHVLSEIGSLIETPDQRGIAHFLEHMVFKGSKNYPGHKTLETLENMGLQQGKEFNGSVSNIKTEYHLSIPAGNDAYLKKSLYLLKDWMYNLEMNPNELEIEKKIIYEELKLRGDGVVSPFVIGTHLEGHNGLGSKEDVASITANQLRDFYKANYTPDRLALVIIGKVNEEKTIKLLNKIFSDTPKVNGSTKRSEYLKLYNKTVISGNYKEGKGNKSGTVLSLAFKEKRVGEDTYENFKQGLVDNLFTNIIEARLKNSDKQLFGNSVTNVSGILPGNKLYVFRLKSEADSASYVSMLNGFCKVVAQAKTHGILQEEITFFSQQQLGHYEKYNNDSFIDLNKIEDYFFRGNTPLSGKTRYELAKQAYKNLSPDDFTPILNRFVSNHKTILFDSTSVAFTPDFNETTILNKFENIGKLQANPYQFKKPKPKGFKKDNVVPVAVEIETPTPEKIAERRQLADDMVLFTYQNGISVVLHNTKETLCKIKVLGASGLNAVPETDRAFFKDVAEYVEGGFGTYNASEAATLQRKMNIVKKIEVSNYNYRYTLKAPTQVFAEMLKIFNLSFTQATPTNAGDIINRFERFNKKEQSNDMLYTELRQSALGQFLETKAGGVVNQQNANRFFQYNQTLKACLNNAVIYVRGNLPSNAESLISTYVAPVKPVEVSNSEALKNPEVKQANGKVYHASSWTKPLGYAEHLFTQQFEGKASLKNELIYQAISRYGYKKMFEILRKKYGLTYGLGSGAYAYQAPNKVRAVSLRYMTDYKNIEQSITIFKNEVLRPMHEANLNKAEIKKLKAMLGSECLMAFYDEAQITETYLQWQLKYGKLPTIKELEKLIKGLSASELKTAMKTIIHLNDYFVFVRHPKS